MITRTATSWHTPEWQKLLAQAIRDPAELLRRLELPLDLLPAAQAASNTFPLRVPLGYVARMQKGNPHDPLLRQVLPLGDELKQAPGFTADPVGDLAAMPVAGLLHKYRGRVLLVTTAACGIHCRYCFRRHFPYTEANPAEAQWQGALEYIHADTSIEEVILSGGDPLSLADHRLAELVCQLETIPQLKRLRLHTRQPVVLPERVDTTLLQWLADCPLQKIMVIHCNHANELDTAVGHALSRIKACDVTLLNQAVLLRGVNDTLSAQVALNTRLFEQGVLPYYLHQLDRVQGAHHFEVPSAESLALLEQLRQHLPGYLIPQLVTEQAGAQAKIPLSSYW